MSQRAAGAGRVLVATVLVLQLAACDLFVSSAAPPGPARAIDGGIGRSGIERRLGAPLAIRGGGARVVAVYRAGRSAVGTSSRGLTAGLRCSNEGCLILLAGAVALYLVSQPFRLYEEARRRRSLVGIVYDSDGRPVCLGWGRGREDAEILADRLAPSDAACHPLDPTRSFQTIELCRAARAGGGQARLRLARIFMGDGEAEGGDPAAAYKWLRLAELAGEEVLDEERRRIVERLSREQRGEIEARLDSGPPGACEAALGRPRGAG